MTFVTYNKRMYLTSISRSTKWENKSYEEIETLEKEINPNFILIGEVVESFNVEDQKIEIVKYLGCPKGVKIHGSTGHICERKLLHGNPAPIVAGDYCNIR